MDPSAPPSRRTTLTGVDPASRQTSIASSFKGTDALCTCLAHVPGDVLPSRRVTLSGVDPHILPAGNEGAHDSGPLLKALASMRAGHNEPPIHPMAHDITSYAAIGSYIRVQLQQLLEASSRRASDADDSDEDEGRVDVLGL